MSLNSFFQFFVPKEKRFYPLYAKQAEYIEKAAKLLRQMINETDLAQLEALKKEIKACETGGDAVLDDFHNTLFSAVMTPFEREDVHELAELMDSFLDRIDDCGNIILTRRFLDVDEDLTTMATNLMFAAESLRNITDRLPDLMNESKRKEISRLCQEIKTIEHDSDELYGSYIRKLFSQNYSLTEIIKHKDLVQVLEDACNAAKYISDKVRSIINKL
jgi:predicted phosphate transport protein (TIGR00153 family)